MVKKGLLLVNLGTPNSPSLYDVRQYLAQFLNDPRVVNLPRWLRFSLLYTFILPFRAKRSAHAYAKIWTPQGSPLLHYCQSLASALQVTLKEKYIVRLGMRYGNPSIPEALQALSSCESLTILPLYPHYASASTGSSLEAILKILAQQTFIPSLKIIHAFYDHPEYIKAQASLINPYLSSHDFVLFSYHGLPEKQKTARSYRAQCETTSKLLAIELNLANNSYASSFQSRFGKTPWLKPYTEEYLIKLANKGVKKLLVACPGFTADCLETLEEIGIQAQQQWLHLGGESLTLVPSLNASAVWVKAIVKMIA